jgi:hypothetical protein
VQGVHDHVVQRDSQGAALTPADGDVMSVMSQLDQLRSYDDTRCGGCGQTEEASGVPVTTIVIDFRAELMCDACVAGHDWSDWTFDPILNLYMHA